MAKIILSMLVSIDGYIESTDTTLDWFNMDAEVDEYMLKFIKSGSVLIYGRKMYESMVEYWPNMPKEFADVINEKPKFITTNTLKEVKLNATILNNKELEIEIKAMKVIQSNPIILFGGADIARTFIYLRLIDEIRLLVSPYALCAGKPLFRDFIKLKWNKSHPFKCGSLLHFYKPVY
jgi:dihydrofolate reductase